MHLHSALPDGYQVCRRQDRIGGITVDLKRVIILIVGLFFLAGAGNSSAGQRIFRGEITNGNGEPAVNAVVYLEAHRKGKGAFDFGYVTIDSASGGTFTLSLKWKWNALLAYAIFVPGRETITGFDWTRYYSKHDLVFYIDSADHNGRNCATGLLGMSFPFEEKPALAKRLQRNERRQLTDAFIEAYQPILDGDCPPPSGNEGKLEAVRELCPEKEER